MSTRKSLRRRSYPGETLKRYIYYIFTFPAKFLVGCKLIRSCYQDLGCSFIWLCDLIAAGSCRLEAEAWTMWVWFGEYKEVQGIEPRSTDQCYSRLLWFSRLKTRTVWFLTFFFWSSALFLQTLSYPFMFAFLIGTSYFFFFYWVFFFNFGSFTFGENLELDGVMSNTTSCKYEMVGETKLWNIIISPADSYAFQWLKIISP